MKYRPEIDGLRALAVLPVILSHAGFSAFHGGFVGVDVFFVISGFLITTILLAENAEGRFSILGFYERRARRILPALFLVMACSTALAWWSLLPDELENFGQSLFATSAFANNMLLMLTSGYWSLASEFKPLLHTWSLGVEEQFYILFPLLLMACRRWRAQSLLGLFALLSLLSLVAAEWASLAQPTLAFYLLPTRAWELLLGSMAALCARQAWLAAVPRQAWQPLSLLGLAMVLAAILGFGEAVRSPSLWILLPTVGAVLIILFALPGTWAHRLLASKVPVGIGLISYSAYLWHQPLFAFARIIGREKPSDGLMLALSGLTLVLAHASWRWVEQPFRHSAGFGRRFIFSASLAGSVLFAGIGLHLHLSHGLPERVYGASAKGQSGMYVTYNERVFQRKVDAFVRQDARKVLVHGNSYARDFVNMNLEAFDQATLEFVYRDDFPECLDQLSGGAARLYAQADVIVYASGGMVPGVKCVQRNIAIAQAAGKAVYYVGGKHFGYNLNWLARLSAQERALQTNAVIPVAWEEGEALRAAVPASHFLPIYQRVMLQERRMPVADAAGRMLSPDRVHLTQDGAVYVGQRVLWDTAYEQVLGRPARKRAAQP